MNIKRFKCFESKGYNCKYYNGDSCSYYDFASAKTEDGYCGIEYKDGYCDTFSEKEKKVKSKKKKRHFTKEDPYGEENWEK
jgi:hypothetical protein